MQVSLQIQEGGETYLLQPSRRLKRATSAINHVFLSATPFDHTQLCHVQPQCACSNSALVKVVKFINRYVCIQATAPATALVHARGVCALESCSFSMYLDTVDVSTSHPTFSMPYFLELFPWALLILIISVCAGIRAGTINKSKFIFTAQYRIHNTV